jgi:hypothetical protein
MTYKGPLNLVNLTTSVISLCLAPKIILQHEVGLWCFKMLLLAKTFIEETKHSEWKLPVTDLKGNIISLHFL